MHTARDNGFRGSAAFFALLLNATAAAASPGADPVHAVTQDHPAAGPGGDARVASKFSRRRQRLAALLRALAPSPA